MKRALILVLDSFGIGASLDADRYGDQGANTLGHIAEACANGHCDAAGRQGPLNLPNLSALGLGIAALASCGKVIPGLSIETPCIGQYGYAVERSVGKDTPSGHWEMAGLPVMIDFGYFPPEYPSFPAAITDALIEQGGLPGILGNKHASGTEIIELLGEEHIQSGKPIVYTSGDSVLQIAAHETTFGLEKLYQLCQLARRLVDPYHVGRVIARPFVTSEKGFVRSANRKDYAIPPHGDTLLDICVAQGKTVVAIGKIADIFAHRGISISVSAADNMSLFDETLRQLAVAEDQTLIFTNFVDFDSVYGHRRDVTGYAKALEAFDQRLPELLSQLTEDDLLIITADHGCDPTFPGSDHTREHVPVLAFRRNQASGFIGRRETIADVGQTVAEHLGLSPLDFGIAF